MIEREYPLETTQGGGPVASCFVNVCQKAEHGSLGWLRYAGKVDRPGAKVTLTVTADGQPYRVESATGGAYAFKVGLRPGFVRYHAKLTSELAGTSVTLHEADDLVAGRAYLIAGQSNAVATDWGKGEATYRNDWIRTYGTTSTNPRDTGDWGAATHRALRHQRVAEVAGAITPVPGGVGPLTIAMLMANAIKACRMRRPATARPGS